MSKGSELFKNTLILGLGSFAAQIAGFVLLPVYTRMMTASEYGLVDLVIVTSSLLVPALTLQLHLASFRFLVEKRDSKAEQIKIVSNTAAIVCGLGLVWSVLALGLGSYLGIQYVQFMILTGLSVMLLNNTSQIARGLGRNLAFAISNIITAAMTLILGVSFVAGLKLGVVGVLLSLTFSNTMGALYLIMRLRLYSFIELKSLSRTCCHQMLQYSVPLIPNGLAWWINNAADRVIISILLGTGANGIYAASSKFVTLLNAPNSVFAMAWAEAATLHINAKDRDEFFLKLQIASFESLVAWRCC